MLKVLRHKLVGIFNTPHSSATLGCCVISNFNGGISKSVQKSDLLGIKIWKSSANSFSLLFGYLLLSHFKFLSDFDGAFDTLRHKLRVISFSFNLLFYASIVVAWILFRNDLRDRLYYPFAL